MQLFKKQSKKQLPKTGFALVETLEREHSFAGTRTWKRSHIINIRTYKEITSFVEEMKK